MIRTRRESLTGRARQPVADVLADGLGAGVVATGDGDVGTTVGCGVTVWCGVAVRCGDADGLGVRWCGVRLGDGVGAGVGEGLCCTVPGLSLAALALGGGGLTHRYSTSVPRKTATSTQVEVLTRSTLAIRRCSRCSRCSRSRHPPAWAAG